MTDPEHNVKRRRPYRSEQRRRQAAETRERVLDAARALFTQHGYEATTIAAVANEAGVSAETVYATFRNKRTLFGELFRRSVRGADPAPAPRQAGARAVMAATDQQEQLRLFAADIVQRLERAAPLVSVLTAAARTDPELAELLATVHKERLKNMLVVVDALASRGPLRLERREAAEAIWALASPDLHQLFTRTHGWSRKRYCAWLADSLAALLLVS